VRAPDAPPRERLSFSALMRLGRSWSWPSILRTQAYRIVLVYVAVFAISVTALIAFTYWNTKRALDAQTDQIIEAEITGLSEQYQQLGLRASPRSSSAVRRMAGPGFISLPTRKGSPSSEISTPGRRT